MNASGDKFTEASVAWETGNLVEAFDLFLYLAERGDAASQNNLGYFFDKGLGVAPDKLRAKYWYGKAVENGEVSALANLALLYQEGGETESAVCYLKKAIALGDGDAALELAKLYLDKKPLVDRQKAKECLEHAIGSDSVTPDSLQEAQKLYKLIQ